MFVPGTLKEAEVDFPANEEKGLRRERVRLVHPRTGRPLKPTLTSKEGADILGWPERTVREHARMGLLPTMKRAGSRGQYRIITADLLKMLGLLRRQGK
jgi:hypothetical protein